MSDDAPIVPQDVAHRWRKERDEAWAGIRQYREQRDMARTEVDRLRARVAELETAGDRVADSVEAFESWDELAGRDLLDDLAVWRAVRGEQR